MLHAVEYCECGNELSYVMIFLRKSEKETIGIRAPFCSKCLKPIEINYDCNIRISLKGCMLINEEEANE